MDNYELASFPDDKQLAEVAAREWLEWLAGVGKSGPVLVAVSGGRIARTFFSSAALQGRNKRALFDPVHFFWADERCVPRADPESNYGIAKELLFTPLTIPEKQIHRVRGEEPPQVAAARAAKELAEMAPRSASGKPIFDMILLGMGEDGHVASLFPGEAPMDPQKEPVYRAVRATKPPPERITLGYTVLVAAKEVWVLASGSGKEKALGESLLENASTPLGKVLRERKGTRILTDIRL